MTSVQDNYNDPPKTNKRIYLKLSAVLLPLFVLWGIPELITRLANPALQQYKAIYFGGDANSPMLFMKDPILHWRLRPNVEVNFLNVLIRTDENGFRGKGLDPNAQTILCLGDSTTFGWRVDEESTFVFKLEKILNHCKMSSFRWQVINAGVPGYTSFQVKLNAEALLQRWKPKYLIMLIGNNEAWPSKQSDKQIHDDTRLEARLVKILSYSKFLLWLKELIRPDTLKPFIAQSFEGSGPRVSRDEYVTNISEIISFARRKKTSITLVAPPVNLYYPPLRRKAIPNEAFTIGVWQKVKGLMDANELEKGLLLVDEGLAKDPDNFALLWLRGIIFVKQGRAELGRVVLEEAFEKHPFPDRCKLSYRRALKEIALRNNTSYLDVNELYTSVSQDKTTAGLYMDWCHPTAIGHEIIARNLAKIILNTEVKKQKAKRTYAPQAEIPT
jgi:lysophospholipase L1-like esterase